MRQADVVRLSGVSDPTVRRIMRGDLEGRTPVTLARVSEAVGWSPDSIARILDGGEPELVSLPGDDVLARLERLERLTLRLALLVEERLGSDSDLSDLRRRSE